MENGEWRMENELVFTGCNELLYNNERGGVCLNGNNWYGYLKSTGRTCAGGTPSSFGAWKAAAGRVSGAFIGIYSGLKEPIWKISFQPVVILKEDQVLSGGAVWPGWKKGYGRNMNKWY